MTGAGSNMLQAHAYVKLLAVTTWIIAIWPSLSSWSGSFILWFNIGFEIPRPTLTSTLLQLVVTGTAWVVRSEVVLAVAHSTVLSSSRESVLCLCSVGRSCSGGLHI